MNHHEADVGPRTLEASAAVDERDLSHRQAMADALASWVAEFQASAGTVDAARQRLHTVERVAQQVESLLAEQRRQAALFALGAGMSAAGVGTELGLTRWAVHKRWPELADEARPLRWLSANQSRWSHTLQRLVQIEQARLEHLGPEQRQALLALAAVIADGSLNEDWWILRDTPELVRVLLSGPALPAGADIDDHIHRDLLYAELADYDLYRAGGKASPRSAVTAAAVRIATLQRLGRS